MAPAIHAFLATHPQLQVELTVLDRVVDLVEKGFDLGVRIAQLSDSSLIASKLGEVRRVVVASPALVKQVGQPAHPRELSALPTVQFRRSSLPAGWSFLDRGRRLTVTAVEPRLTTNLTQVGVQACERGLGSGRSLSYQVQASLKAGRLRTVLADFEPEPTPVQLVFAHARLLSARTRALVDWLKAHCTVG